MLQFGFALVHHRPASQLVPLDHPISARCPFASLGMDLAPQILAMLCRSAIYCLSGVVLRSERRLLSAHVFSLAVRWLVARVATEWSHKLLEMCCIQLFCIPQLSIGNSRTAWFPNSFRQILEASLQRAKGGETSQIKHHSSAPIPSRLHSQKEVPWTRDPAALPASEGRKSLEASRPKSRTTPILT